MLNTELCVKLCRVVVIGAALSLSACVVYEPVPQRTVQQRFDSAWAAAGGAMLDNGLTITSQDRGAGVIRGERNGVGIIARLETLADGSIQVKLSSQGGTADPDLIHRVSDAYDRRMGR